MNGAVENHPASLVGRFADPTLRTEGFVRVGGAHVANLQHAPAAVWSVAWRRRRARILFGVFCEPWERGGGDATLVVGARCAAVGE